MKKEEFLERVSSLPGIKVAPTEVSCFGLALYFVGDSICNTESKVAMPNDIIFCSEYSALGDHVIRCDQAGTFEQQVTESSAEELIEIVRAASKIYENVVTNDKADVQILITLDPDYIDIYLGSIKDHMTDLETDLPIDDYTEFIKLTGIKITDDLMKMILDTSSDNYAISKVAERDSTLFFENSGAILPFEENEVKLVMEKAQELKNQCNKEIGIFCFADD